MKQKRVNRNRDDVLTGGGWMIVKRYPGGREEIVERGLSEEQAYHLGDRYVVGCLEGETVTLRSPLIFDFD